MESARSEQDVPAVYPRGDPDPVVFNGKFNSPRLLEAVFLDLLGKGFRHGSFLAVGPVNFRGDERRVAAVPGVPEPEIFIFGPDLFHVEQQGIAPETALEF